MFRQRFHSLLLVFALGACASPPADVDELLAPPRAREGSDPDVVEVVRAAGGRFDALAARLRAGSAEAPGDAALAVAASRALFHAADARILAATLALVEDRPQLTVDQLIDADARLPRAVERELRREVLGLSREGRRLAEQALDVDPGRADALLYRALHLSLEGWALGVGAALLGGLGSRIPAAIRAALEADPGYDGGAPLRLMGRFLDRAPWPLGDRAR